MENIGATLNILAILPMIVLALGSCILLLLDLWLSEERKTLIGWGALLVIVATGVVAILYRNIYPTSAFNDKIAYDGFAYLLTLVVLFTGALSILLAIPYLQRNKVEHAGDFFVLLLFTMLGMMTMAVARDLLVVFVGIELLSIPLYVLAGFLKKRSDSEESAMKYFLLGAFASAFLVYGMAMVYGATQSTQFDVIASAISAGTAKMPFLFVGVGLTLVGLGFKVAAVPFQMWTPDVYEGAPTPVTAFMSVGAKAAGFAALARIFFEPFAAVSDKWALPIAIMAALTMLAGNVAAISQKSIKRLLAYSSIAHAGYILMALVAAGKGTLANSAASAIVVYLVAYAITNLGTWAIVLGVEKAPGEGNLVSDYAGLGKRNPAIAVAMTVFMLSLTGLPPTIGFIGKLFVFRTVLDAGFVWLAIVGVITSLFSAYYYLRVIVTMWMQDGDHSFSMTRGMNITVFITAVLSFVLGILPAPLLAFAQNSLVNLFGK